MYRKEPRPIYGKKCIEPISACDYTPFMLALETLTEAISNIVAEFFPAITARARLIGDMEATAGMPPMMFTRLYWAKQHPGQRWTNTEFEQLELIDIYLQFPPLDWKEDYLITVTLPDVSGSTDVPIAP